MLYKPTNPLDSIVTTIISTSRDIMSDPDFAWLYLIVAPDIQRGMRDELINHFGWSGEKERLIYLSNQFQKILKDKL